MADRKRLRWVVDKELELHLLEPEDAETLFALTQENRAYLRQWLSWVDGVESIWDIRRYIHSANRQLEENRGFQTTLRYRGGMAGIVGYQSVDWINRSATLGYWVAARFQGKGLVTRSCETLIDWGFGHWGLNRVEIRCARDNHRSRAIPRRLGFVREGVAREAEWLHDHFSDLIVYGRLARDWPGIRERSKEQTQAMER